MFSSLPQNGNDKKQFTQKKPMFKNSFFLRIIFHGTVDNLYVLCVHFYKYDIYKLRLCFILV